MTGSKKSGVCKLTGKSGTFVDSHLLPKAITKPNISGAYFIEGGQGNRPVRRFSSWYDNNLVTRDGEDILARYDSWGIAELQRLKLIWSSWGPMTSLSTSDWTTFRLDQRHGHGMRELTCSDPIKFRLFFLSLLWRAAATTRPEFSAIQVEESELQQLTAMVRDGDPASLNFYPTTLMQIAAQGPVHNFIPLAIDEIVDIEGSQPWHRYLFRFYFDGLIAFMHRPRRDAKMIDFGKFVVGYSKELAVQTIPIEGAFQIENLLKARFETHLQWPKTMEKLDGFPAARRDHLLQAYELRFGHGKPWTEPKE